MENTSESNASCGLRRRSVGIDNSGRNLPLNLQVGFTVTDGGVIQGTPTPGEVLKMITDDDEHDHRPSSSIAQFRKKQQSFEIHIEDCDEEEMSAGSSDEEDSRPLTPLPPQMLPDCSSGNVTHKERLPQEDFLQVGAKDTDCLTDVSEGESENEDDVDEERVLPENSVIKRVPY